MAHKSKPSAISTPLNPIANDPLLELAGLPVSPSPSVHLREYYENTAQRYLDLELEDLRRYHPAGPARPLVSRSGTRTRMALDPMRSLRAFPRIKAHIVGEAARATRIDVLVCARRKARREVLHALDKLKPKRRGAGGGRKHHRNWKSYIKC